MSFLPENYQLPYEETEEYQKKKKEETSRYMKFEVGENRFRVISPALTGYQYWKANKPIKTRTREELPKELKEKEIEHFWVFVVYNPKKKGEFSIQIAEIRQKSIRKEMKDIIDEFGDPKWGYDFKVIREGEGKDKTRYKTVPSLPKPLENEEEVRKLLKEHPVNLEALYDGGNPFESSKLDDILS